MRIACWITKATDTHSEYVILTVFALQQSLHERTSLLRYTYIAFLVYRDACFSSKMTKSQHHLVCREMKLKVTHINVYFSLFIM